MHSLAETLGGWFTGDGAAVAAVDAAGTVIAARPPDLPADGRCEIGSVTKTMTVTVLASLVADGIPGLDDPIGPWLLAGPNGEITIRQLATHTSGLPAVAPKRRADPASRSQQEQCPGPAGPVKALSIARPVLTMYRATAMGRCHDERSDVMSGTFTPEQAGGEAVDLRGAGAEPTDGASQQGAGGLARSFVVTIKTPAGHEHPFRVSSEQRVETVTARAVAYFVKHGELAEGKYVLAVMRDGTPEDMTALARLEDYAIREGDVLVLIHGTVFDSTALSTTVQDSSSAMPDSVRKLTTVANSADMAPLH